MNRNLMWLTMAAVVGMASALPAEESVLSPDGRNEIVLSGKGGVIEWSVRRDGQTVIEPSRIAMDVAGRNYPASLLALGGGRSRANARRRYTSVRRWTSRPTPSK